MQKKKKKKKHLKIKKMPSRGFHLEEKRNKNEVLELQTLL